jgi:hypothetical protein
MKLRALLLALCLTACGQGADTTKGGENPESRDPFDINIEIGRYGAMLNQIDEHTRERAGAAEPAVTDPNELSRRLRETVWEYNLQRSRLCAKGLYAELSCGPAYAPVWLSEPDAAAPTLEDVETRADAVGDEVMRLWNAVCEDARAQETNEQERVYVCAME